MAEQLLLPGIEPPRRPTDRLFFAVIPEPSVATSIAELAKRLKSDHGLTGRPLAASRFHVTLHFFGDYPGLPQALVDGLTAAVAGFRHEPFRVTFDRAESFAGRPRKRPLVLRGSDEGLAALMGFRRALSDALAARGLARLADARFTPHVTLLYDDKLLPPQPVEALTWEVREFVLVDSLVGQTRHVPLARWPLGAPLTLA